MINPSIYHHSAPDVRICIPRAYVKENHPAGTFIVIVGSYAAACIDLVHALLIVKKAGVQCRAVIKAAGASHKAFPGPVSLEFALSCETTLVDIGPDADVAGAVDTVLRDLFPERSVRIAFIMGASAAP